MQDAIEAWAREEFGDAELNDRRRGARLVAMAAAVARRPRGKVTSVFDEDAAREAAYRFLESDAFDATAISAAAHRAAARRAAVHPMVYVAADQSALQITDRAGTAFGPLSRKDMGTGVQAMTALVVDPDGTPLGLAAQSLWTRTTKRSPSYRADRRPVEERETQFWLDALNQATAVLKELAPNTLPWFQLDRGADASHVLHLAAQLEVAFTVRSSAERRIMTATGKAYLHRTLAASPVLGRYSLAVRGTTTRPARTAIIEVRACAVTLDLGLGLRGTRPMVPLPLTAIEAREVDADVDAPILWRLLTNHSTTTMVDARQVIRGYTMRWRVEDFHLAWKSGTCHIEDSQLRSLDHFAKWATILATVAIRADRLKQLARETPDLPADVEFSRDEIDAVILLRKPKGVALGTTPTLGQLVRWIADYGGYTGKSSGGPPGVRIISRALIEVLAVAAALARLRTQQEGDL